MRDANAARRLATLLARLEEDVLNAPARELLADPGASEAARSVASIIQDCLAAHSPASATPIPAGSADRRRLLDLVIRGNPRLPTELRMAYSAKQTISDQEVMALLAKLQRSGFLTKPKKD